MWRVKGGQNERRTWRGEKGEPPKDEESSDLGGGREEKLSGARERLTRGMGKKRGQDRIGRGWG